MRKKFAMFMACMAILIAGYHASIFVFQVVAWHYTGNWHDFHLFGGAQ